MTAKTFTTDNCVDRWFADGHNRRTRAAFECGVHRAATGTPATVYAHCSQDYRLAEQAGAAEARRRMHLGERWVCDLCKRAVSPQPRRRSAGR